MTDIPITKGEPVPEERSGRTIYPFADMAPGDMIHVPADHRGAYVAARHRSPRAVNSAHVYGMNRGWKFRTQVQDDGSIKIWRVS